MKKSVPYLPGIITAYTLNAPRYHRIFEPTVEIGGRNAQFFDPAAIEADNESGAQKVLDRKRAELNAVEKTI
jgi:hypothetical protein